MAYSREVRLGIVLYGGVSLAVYENGIAQEVYRAVRGEGVYALIKDLIDSDIVTDVISGTSAGGVNGILLGYALANGANFSSVARLWREDGDIAKLLRERDDPETGSLLRSETYYHEQLVEAMQRMPPWMPAAGSAPSPIGELDLFVTGTHVAGRVSTFYDDHGHPIDVKDHRGVFKLTYRRGRKNDFAPESRDQLARLARITSSFPAAFAPVTVDSSHADLRRWGRLGQDAVFLDGGILDNKPFSYAIDSIFRRTATRDVTRFLMYVEPAPERFEQAAQVSSPGVVDAVVDALVHIPGYESIASDLRSIAEHNDRITRLEALLRCVPPLPAGAAPDLRHANRVPDTGPEWALYTAARAMQLRNRAVEGILNVDGSRPYLGSKAERRAARILVDSFEQWDVAAAETLDAFDVYFRLRRLFHLTYTIKTYLYDDPQRPADPAVRQNYEALWSLVNHHIKLLEIVQAAMEQLLDRTPFEWRALQVEFVDDGEEREPTPEELKAVAARLWDTIAGALSRLLDPEGLRAPLEDLQQERSQFSTSLLGRARNLADTPLAAQAGPPPARTVLQLLDEAVVDALERFPARASSPVVAEYARFLDVDRHIFPLQFAAGTDARDIIRIVRVSPADAQRGLSGRPLDKKVCGVTLGAFGGFFKKPWRSNDIMWGRLDGVCQLIECTLTRSRVAQVWRQPPPVADIEQRLASIFPSSTPADVSQLASEIANLGALNDREFDSALTRLVEAAQREIVQEEWPQVVHDSIDQERDWSQYRVDPALMTDTGAAAGRTAGTPAAPPVFAADRLVWHPATSSPDRLLVALAAKHVAASDNRSLFDTYEVAGRPFLDEIPGPVLLELATLAILRLERSVMGGLSPRTRKRLQVPAVYTFLFRWLLPALYGWATFSRRAPEWRVSLDVGLVAASVAVGASAVILLFWGVDLPLPAYGMMLLLPALVLLVQLFRFGRGT